MKTKKPKKTGEKTPKWAPTKTKLAAAMNVTRSTIPLWEAREDFPAPGPQGWDVAEVRRWREATVAPQGRRRTGGEDHGVRADLLRAQVDDKRAKAALSTLRLQIEQGQYVALDEIREWDTSRTSVVKRGLLSFSRSLPSALVGLNEKEMAVLIDQRVRELLERFGRFTKKELQAEPTSSS